jgi:RYK receptor-like tyrosine kinase
MIFLLFLLHARGVSSSFNLYLSTQEMKRLLGLENELYYVQDGTVNKYALGFVIPVPTSVSALHFTWAAPPPSSLQYSLTTSSSHPGALLTPPVNISSQGIVPTAPQVWRLSIQCTGTEAAEVVVTLDIQLVGLDPALPYNTTDLRFRRKKVCFLTEADTEVLGQVQRVPAYVVFFSGVGACLLLLVLVLSLVIGTWLRSTASLKRVSDPANSTQYTPVPDVTQNNSGLLNQSLRSQDSKEVGRPNYSTSTLLPAPHRSLGDGLTTDGEWQEEGVVSVESLLVDRLALTLGDLLLEGTFGRVY